MMIATLAANTAKHTLNASFSSFFCRNFGGQNFVTLKKKLKRVKFSLSRCHLELYTQQEPISTG